MKLLPSWQLTTIFDLKHKAAEQIRGQYWPKANVPADSDALGRRRGPMCWRSPPRRPATPHRHQGHGIRRGPSCSRNQSPTAWQTPTRWSTSRRTGCRVAVDHVPLLAVDRRTEAVDQPADSRSAQIGVVPVWPRRLCDDRDALVRHGAALSVRRRDCQAAGRARPRVAPGRSWSAIR